MIDHERTSLPVCPHCGHKLTDDEIHASRVDVWALAPAEAEDDLDCPACRQHYHIRGSYVPEYTTSRHNCDVCDFDAECTCGVLSSDAPSSAPQTPMDAGTLPQGEEGESNGT